MVEKTLSAADLPRLVVQLPDGKEVHHSIAGSEVTIGRDPSNRITIADQFVSKCHAKLLVSHASITLVDLGSANKTYVNGQPISELPVKYGDELQFAGVRCRLVGPESAERHAAPPPPPGSIRSAPAGAPSAPPEPVSPQRLPAAPGRFKAAKAAKPAKAAAAPVAGRSTPPPIEADPMKRLLRIGGLLILVSLALAVMLRILLVPSGEPAKDSGKGPATEPTTTAPVAAAEPTPTPTPTPTPPPTTPNPTQPAGATRAPAPGSSRPGSAPSAQDYFDQALSFLDTGRLKEAETAFKKVLEIEPENASARTRLALLQEEIAQKADQHFGNARQAFQYLRYDEAIAEWEMFLTLADSSDVRYSEAEQGIAQAKAKLR
jgi:predicted component of type VI protein secretion system